MKFHRHILAGIAVFALGTAAYAADGNTRAPADTPQDRASDRRMPSDAYTSDDIANERRGEAQGGTAGAYEGSTGGQPEGSSSRAGQVGSGGAQTGDLGASSGGADNAMGRRNPSAAGGDAASPRSNRKVPEYP